MSSKTNKSEKRKLGSKTKFVIFMNKHPLLKMLIPAGQNTLYLMFSFCAAFFIWYTLTVQEQVEAPYDVRIEYTNLPKDLVVTEGLINTVSVRLRGSANFFSTLSNKDLTYTLDLSSVKKGATVIPIEFETDARYRILELVSVQPAQIVIISEGLVEKEVLLEPLMMEHDDLKNYVVSDIAVSPEKVTIKGAESIIKTINRIIVPFNPTLEDEGGEYTDSLGIITPKSTEATQKIVDVSYKVKERYEEKTFELPITLITDDDESKYKLSKEKAKIILNVPANLDENELIKELKITAEPSGASKEVLTLGHRIPENVFYIGIQPNSINITKE